MERLGFDLVAALTLTVTALLGAYLPVLLYARDRLRGGTGRSVAYVLGNLFSAGVMVSAGFCHLLGEALKQMPAMQFPLAPFLCGLGFLMTLAADQLASRLSGGHGARCGHAALDGGATGAGTVDAVVPPPANLTLTTLPARLERPPIVLTEASLEVRAAGELSPTREEIGGGGGAGGGGARARAKDSPSTPGGERDSLLGGGEGNGRRTALEVEEGRAGGKFERSRRGGARGGAAAGGAAPPHVAFVTAMLMGMALVFHSVLEGAAMGAQITVSASMHIFIAIVSHKGLAAYALGSSIVDSGAGPRRFWSVILPFTFASPVGILLGLVVSDVARGIGAASISALASGTFLYVAFMEVIPKELREPGYGAEKLAALMAGFGVMSVLAIWA